MGEERNRRGGRQREYSVEWIKLSKASYLDVSDATYSS